MTASQAANRARNAVRKAVALLLYEFDNPTKLGDAGVDQDTRWLTGYESEQMLELLLWEGESLVQLLNPDADFDSLRRYTDALGKSLRRASLLPKLEDTTGRTDEEAAAFRAKAKELRSS